MIHKDKIKILLIITIILNINLKFYFNENIYKIIKFNPIHKKSNNRYFYISKYGVKYEKKKKKNINAVLNENKKIRPERKFECNELIIRNEKKFPKYAKKPAAPIANLFYFTPFRNIEEAFEPIDLNIKEKLRTEGFQFKEEKNDSNIFPSLDEIIENGDPSTNMHFYRRKKLKSLLYQDPFKFVKGKKLVEKYNRNVPPEKQLNYSEFRCDIYYVHSNGTIMNIEENRSPYDKEIKENERYKEPRFIITVHPGHAKKNNLKVGDIFPNINDVKTNIFDNHFAIPKKIRNPLVLPDGRKIP